LPEASAAWRVPVTESAIGLDAMKAIDVRGCGTCQESIDAVCAHLSLHHSMKNAFRMNGAMTMLGMEASETVPKLKPHDPYCTSWWRLLKASGTNKLQQVFLYSESTTLVHL
jgi:hypothetical protein